MEIVLIVLGVIVGGAGGFFAAQGKGKKDAANAEIQAKKIIAEASDHASKAEARARQADEQKHASLEDARKEAESIRAKAEKTLTEAKTEEKQIREKLETAEKRLTEKEANLDKKTEAIDTKRAALETRATEVEKIKAEAENHRDAQKSKLEEIAGLKRDEAKTQLLAEVEKDSADELAKKIREAETKAKEEGDKKAQKIIALSIQRLANEVTSESTVTLVNLPSDDIKGRIIGREGRNITAFEMATGVDVIVDDTPGAVIISGFDLVRRYVAKTALEKLISDGRIHPAKIEEAVKKADAETQDLMKEFGEKAVIEVGVVGLPPQVVKLLGRLRFRTSYGQNNLKHAIEAAYLGSAIASELGYDVKKAKMACLLHDIGKAVDHEIEGPHAVIGANILRKFKLDEDVIHAVEAHHEDVPMESVLDIITHVADAISGSRPGARRESLENYIQRLQELENIATGFTGVEKAFAIQAGREVRVLVNSEKTDDLSSLKLSKEIAKKIEQDMAYPGQIKVNVIRETRAVEYAK